MFISIWRKSVNLYHDGYHASERAYADIYGTGLLFVIGITTLCFKSLMVQLCHLESYLKQWAKTTFYYCYYTYGPFEELDPIYNLSRFALINLISHLVHIFSTRPAIKIRFIDHPAQWHRLPGSNIIQQITMGWGLRDVILNQRSIDKVFSINQPPHLWKSICFR
jgi:hypothetical protein